MRRKTRTLPSSSTTARSSWSNGASKPRTSRITCQRFSIRNRIYLNLVEPGKGSNYSTSSVRMNTRENSNASTSSDLNMHLASRVVPNKKPKRLQDPCDLQNDGHCSALKNCMRKNQDSPSSYQRMNQFSTFKNDFPQRAKDVIALKAHNDPNCGKQIVQLRLY